MHNGMSMTSMVILFCAITSFQPLHAGGVSWPNDAFSNKVCNNDRQPIVEIWTANGVQYMFISQRVTWEEGRMLCLNYNARLAILDYMEKAVSVAQSIAASNIEMEGSWIGGRRVDFAWTWIDAGTGPGIKIEIPMEPNVEDFPPWTREPTRPTKECLAIDRRSHDHPNFIDLDCRLQRPIICEKKSEDMRVPIPSKWIEIGRNTFTLYHGRVTWHEAATFCRARGTRLAILRTSTVINILTNSMTKTRPDFETIWIGGYFSYGQWVWMATGSILNPLTDETGYPPWRSGRPEKNDGCLLLDRHIEDSTNFIVTTCDRKHDFVCEEYPEDEDEDWLNEPAKFAHGNSTYIIYPLDKTWSESRSFCNERGSVLAHVGSIDTLNLIIEAMGDHPREIHHIWLGGKFRSKTDAWHWIDTDEEIPKTKNELGFPPWARVDTGLDHDPASSSCLNVDRADHVKPHFYSLDCASKQPFVCKITCDVPPSVKNGTWKCYEIAEGRECSLNCDAGLMVVGVRNVTCSVLGGWVTGLHWFEFPLCLEPGEYTSRMIRSISHDVQKSAGYYVLIDHIEPGMRSLSLNFAERLVKAFPVSRNLQMGMTCFATDPPTHLSFNQTDNCEILKAIYFAKQNIVSIDTKRKSDINSFHNDVSMFNGRRISIIAIVDSKQASSYSASIDQFKSSGHRVIVVGLEEDWKMLLPLATISFDRRSNIFLFDEEELGKILVQLDKLNRRPTKCKKFTKGVAATTAAPITESTVTTVVTTNPIIVTTEEISTSSSEELLNRGLDFPSAVLPVGNNSDESPNMSERRTMISEQQLTKEKDTPRIYSEQGVKRDTGIIGNEPDDTAQTIVTRESSNEAQDNAQEQEKVVDTIISTSPPLEESPDESSLPTDGNESAN